MCSTSHKFSGACLIMLLHYELKYGKKCNSGQRIMGDFGENESFFAVIKTGFYTFNSCKNWRPILLFWNSKECIFLLNVKNVCLDGYTITSKTKINISWFLFLHTTSPSQLFGHRLQSIYFIKTLILAFEINSA